MEEYYDGAGVLVESFVLGDCHVADAPRNDVEGYTLRLRFDVRDGFVLFRHFFHLC